MVVVEGPTGATSRLGYREFWGCGGGLVYFRAIRAVGRSDCSDVLCKGLMDFEHQDGWSL